jgi:hypothetical protein
LFPLFNDRFNIFFFELIVGAVRLNGTRRRLSRPPASGLLSASLHRTMRYRSSGRITRLSVFRVPLLAARGDTAIVVARNYLKVDEETWFNTKSAKQNTKGAKQMERRGRRPKRIFAPFVFCFALFVFLSRSLIGLSMCRWGADARGTVPILPGSI